MTMITSKLTAAVAREISGVVSSKLMSEAVDFVDSKISQAAAEGKHSLAKPFEGFHSHVSPFAREMVYDVYRNAGFKVHYRGGIETNPYEVISWES